MGSHHLEYGFPSTHSTNSVSIALYLHTILYDFYKSEGSTLSALQFHLAQVFLVIYAASIVFGRLYCAMHSFTDCVAGILLGTAIWAVQWTWGQTFETWMSASGWLGTGFICSARFVPSIDSFKQYPLPQLRSPCSWSTSTLNPLMIAHASRTPSPSSPLCSALRLRAGTAPTGTSTQIQDSSFPELPAGKAKHCRIG